MKVLIWNGCWTPNIGNAFVNLGIEQIVRQAFPGCEVVYSADIANKWFFEVSSGCVEIAENSFCISAYLDADLAVWGGMMLTKPIQLAMKAFLALSEREIPILFLGAGADEYTREEADCVAGCLKQLKYVAVITRDDATYELYSKYDFLKWRFARGIDAAFFTADMEVPELSIGSYDVECFDRIVAPSIAHQGKRVIYAHHDCYGNMPVRYTTQKHTLVSELPYDYLALYKNVDTTYAERVHACIASLAFGNRAKLYTDTKRAALFDKVLSHGTRRIKKEAVRADQELLSLEKQHMVENTKTFYHAFQKLKSSGGGKIRSAACYRFILRQSAAATGHAHIVIMLPAVIRQKTAGK